MNHIIKAAKKELCHFDELIKQLESEIAAAPEGTLAIKTNSAHVEYYQRLTGSTSKKKYRRYIPQNEQGLAEALAQKDYNLRVLRLLKEMEASLTALISKFPEKAIDDVFEELAAERKKLVIPVEPTDKLYVEQWLKKPYRGKKFDPGNKSSFYTIKGERVRSKSEVLIANILYHMGIPYKYECPLILNNTVLYPDFTILDIRTRREIYFEHFGMMDNEDYCRSALWKLDFYELNGISLGDRLIVTFESSNHPLDTKVLEKKLERFSLSFDDEARSM